MFDDDVIGATSGGATMAAEVSRRGRTPEARAFRAERVIDVAFELATEGGYEAVQMREVARRADVALATLYRYFPSKSDLIDATTKAQLDALRTDLRVRPSRGTSPQARAVDVFLRALRAMIRNHGWAHAAATAQHSPAPFGVDAPKHAQVPHDLMVGMAAENAWGPEYVPSSEEQLALRMLESLWVSGVVDWLNGLMTPGSVEQQLRFAAEHLIGDDHSPGQAIDRVG